MRPFIIDDSYKEHVQRLIDYAQSHRISFSELMKIAAGKAPPPGDNPQHVADLPFGFRIVFTIEENKNRKTDKKMWTRHMSVSVPQKGRCPHPVVVETIAEWFGFPKMSHCMIWMEDNAVNVIAPIGEIDA